MKKLADLLESNVALTSLKLGWHSKWFFWRVKFIVPVYMIKNDRQRVLQSWWIENNKNCKALKANTTLTQLILDRKKLIYCNGTMLNLKNGDE